MSRDCCVDLPPSAMGLSAVCDSGISWSYSLFLNALGSSGGVNDIWINSFTTTAHVPVYILLSAIFG